MWGHFRPVCVNRIGMEATIRERDEEIERLLAINNLVSNQNDILRDVVNKLDTENDRLRNIIRRHQVAAWCDEDSDLAVETRAALEQKAQKPDTGKYMTSEEIAASKVLIGEQKDT